jgi:hypothetical protein
MCPVEKKGRDCLFDIFSQAFPIIGFRKNRLRQALGYKPAVHFLRDLKNDFVHDVRLCQRREIDKRCGVHARGLSVGGAEAERKAWGTALARGITLKRGEERWLER